MRSCLAIICVLSAAAALHAQEKAAVSPVDVHELSVEQAAAINFAYGGDLSYRYADHCRAGFAQSLRKKTWPAITPNYGGYYVGGGVPIFGEGRYEDEGAFGWDYFGVFPKRVALNWTHGRREQGSGGTYKTDGPKRHHK
jgi:hypothetical protein